MTSFFDKVKESLFSVLPVVAIVLILCCTPLAQLSGKEIAAFAISAVFLVLGMGCFNLGADLAMSPMGEHIGSGLTKSGKRWVLISVCFAMGVLITVAEPDLSVLANQIAEKVSPVTLILSVGAGVVLLLVVGVLKTAKSRSLAPILIFCYAAMFAFAAVLLERGSDDFIAVGFDSGGVTTGPITAPFIMAVGAGISATLGGRNSAENSFGFVALCSVGPILTVMALGMFSTGDMSYVLPDYSVADNFAVAFLEELWKVSKDVALSLGLIVAFFLLLQFTCLHLPKIKLVRMAMGVVYAFVGRVLFLTAVTVGFMPIGFSLGQQLAKSPAALIISALVLGAVVVLAEPAVHVLNKQVEEVTNRAITKKSVLIALSAGVAVSLALSMLRIWLDFSLLYYVIPGYLLSLGLSFFVPKVYTAIAFDSGGVASGPLTTTFILPFAIGACCVMQGEEKILADAFGIVAMVAMTPLITIQLLGFRAVVAQNVRSKLAQQRIVSADDDQIINFM